MSLKTIERLLEREIGLSVKTVGTDTIASTIRRRMDECGMDDEVAYLKYLNTSNQEWDKLIEATIVPETWFFRNQESFTFLVQYIKTEWMPKHKKALLRALSIPCSTGEEPYSMAMTFMNAGLPNNRFSIDAVDISQKGLGKAKQGIYGQESFRRQDIFSFREQYFTLTADDYQIDPSVKKSVHFIRGNLLDDQILSDVKPYDIIFCRNLLIYLNSQAKEKVGKVIDRLLANTGVLFVGHAERPLFQVDGFVSITIPGVFAYYRAGHLNECQICRQNRKPRQFERRKRPRGISAAPHSVVVPPRASQKRGTIHDKQPVLIEQRKSPDEAVNMLNAARELADQGNLKDALRLCEQVLTRDAAHVQAHFLTGLIYQALKDDTRAEECFNKTLYLDPNHHEALYYLTLILEDRGKYDTARQLRQRIQRIYQRTQRD